MFMAFHAWIKFVNSIPRKADVDVQQLCIDVQNCSNIFNYGWFGHSHKMSQASWVNLIWMALVSASSCNHFLRKAKTALLARNMGIASPAGCVGYFLLASAFSPISHHFLQFLTFAMLPTYDRLECRIHDEINTGRQLMWTRFWNSSPSK